MSYSDSESVTEGSSTSILLKTFKTGETDQCPCGNANLTTIHVL